MSGSMGLNLRLSIFGESHGPAIGLVLDGLPPGLALDLGQVQRELERRAPGRSKTATARQEGDQLNIESGLFNGRTTGTPLCARIANKGQQSKDYSQLARVMRPGHADYAGYVHYQGYNDYRGGGHFSGRLTAPLVVAGAIAKQALALEGIGVYAHILRIGPVEERPFNPLGEAEEELAALAGKPFCVLEEAAGQAMEAAILAAKEEQNSLGGVVEVMALGLPPGLGEPYFDSVESRLAHGLFSVPAVKGIEFGAGFRLASFTGAEANDPMYYDQAGRVRCSSNNNGGLTGGLSNGMPLLLRVAIKPTPSIARPQATVDVAKGENCQLTIAGRHDPCIVPRAVPVVEAVTAWQLYDLLLSAKKWVK